MATKKRTRKKTPERPVARGTSTKTSSTRKPTKTSSTKTSTTKKSTRVSSATKKSTRVSSTTKKPTRASSTTQRPATKKKSSRKSSAKRNPKFSFRMRSKLLFFFVVMMLVFAVLIGRLVQIQLKHGEEYQKIVLAQRGYDSTALPYQRGDIVDRNGTILATSLVVYNVILDCYQMTSKDDYIEPTIEALMECFPDLNREQLYTFAQEDKENRYIVLKKRISPQEIEPFEKKLEERDEKGKKVHPNIKGVWFEKEYIRDYPYDSLAGSLIGFTSDGNSGTIGLENYYNDTLNGTNGRKYGYLNADSTLEQTSIHPINGKNIVTTIDVNIQTIVEEKIREFNEAFRDNYRDGEGSLNSAVLIMNPNTGEILAMADYPQFNLNDPRNLEQIYLTDDEDLEHMSDERQLELLNKLWQNFCVSHTFEPGSVQKPLTVACGIETATIAETDQYECDGYEVISGHRIRCVNRSGHGTETLEKSLMDSCNDALMQMAYKIGIDNFTDYQSLFGFGKSTGIDLPGEASAAGLIFTKDNMKTIDLATNVFGQSFNCTMVQMASAVASLINGGHYYTPHVVAKITDDAGNTISTVQPELVKQTVSQSTSDLLRKYMYSVVSSGTGKVAKVDGYSMGGKTGTAQKAARDKNYLLSFIGFAPYENPELLIYCVIDEPNMEDQSHSSYAQNVVREILEEVLPYLNIYPDEELTGINKKLDIAGNPVEETEQEPEIEDEPEEDSEPEAEGESEGEALEPEAEDKPEGEDLEPEAEDKPEGEASEPEAEDKPEDEESEA